MIVPETIVCDRGSIYLSETFVAACSRLGISLQPAHPYTPTDKTVIERGIFLDEHAVLPVRHRLRRRDVTRRARDADSEAIWSLGELQDLFDRWVLAGWQPRPHERLRHPEVPRAALSPNEMYSALVAAAGYVPLALSEQDYLELLPVGCRRITADGILGTSLATDRHLVERLAKCQYR